MIRGTIFVAPVLAFIIILASLAAILLAPKNVSPSGHYDVNPDFTERWRHSDFTGITNTVGFKNAVTQVELNSKVKLDAVEKKNLYAFVVDFLIAYQGKSFEQFKSFRFAQPRGNFTEMFDSLMKETPSARDDSSSDPLNALQIYWEKVDVRQRYGNKANWDSVSLKNSELVVRRVRVIPNALVDSATRRENNGVIEPRPIFIPSPSPNDLIIREGWVDLAALFVVVKTADDVIRPCYLRAYWDSQNKKWVPWEIVFYSPVTFVPVF